LCFCLAFRRDAVRIAPCFNTGFRASVRPKSRRDGWSGVQPYLRHWRSDVEMVSQR
jgi:hypothetical protein